MKRTVLVVVLLTATAQALSGRAAFVFSSAMKQANLQAIACPGKLGNDHTRCASSDTDASSTRKKLSTWKGWKQTDPWKGDSATFTSNGSDGYIVTVMPKIGSKKGSLLIFSEY